MMIDTANQAGIAVLSFLTLAYGFLSMFVMSTLERNRRRAIHDGALLSFAGHGLMAASATGAALVVGMAVWTNFVH